METGKEQRNVNNEESKQDDYIKKSKGKFPWLLTGSIFIGCFAFSLISASILAGTPFRKSLSAHLPHARSNDSLIPDTINRPVNILFLGIDNSGHPHNQDPTHAEALSGNSDTMLLVRLMPDTHKINVLSIPRDTLVELPGKGIDKINDANVIGGAEAAAKSVSNLLSNIPIDHYVRVDTEGFVELIDTLGEVEVNIPKAMHYVDKTQNLYIDFQPGKQKLNGQHFQEYVRFRHDALGDIGRVQRQQEALKALLQTLLKPETVAKIPQLLTVIKNNVDTDFSIGEILGIFEFLSHSDRKNISLVMLPGRFSERSEYKLSYWIANREAIPPILENYFGVTNDQAFNNGSNNKSNKTKTNRIRLAVSNGTNEPNQASKTALFLGRHGFPHTYISKHEVDADNFPLTQTKIIAQRGDVAAANAVKEALGVGTVEIDSIGDIDSDVTVIIGQDFGK